MKYLNLGCGSNYSTNKEWTNLDFVSTGEGVIAHNLLKGIPFENDSFDLVYHSHILEHFSKEDGVKLIQECFRVLKKGGVIRIAIPNLEMIVRNYLHLLESGLNNPNDEIIRANYDWMMLEMYDQTVRNHNGGNMANYLYQKSIINEDFVFERIGEEGKTLRTRFLTSTLNGFSGENKSTNKYGLGNIIKGLRRRIKGVIISRMEKKTTKIGKFRLGGEIHQWMYDRYSLANLLTNQGGNGFVIRDAFTSYIDNWRTFNLDNKDNIVRKPDSLFIEALK